MADTVALQTLYSHFAQRHGFAWPDQGGEGIERNTVAQTSLQATKSRPVLGDEALYSAHVLRTQD